jgi:hypothetical protein
MVGCKTKGCRKHARSPFKHCSRHNLQANSATIESVTTKAVARVTSVGVNKEVASTVGEPMEKAGYFKTFLFEDERSWNSICTIICEEKSKMDISTGYRSMSRPDRPDLIPFLESVVQQARIRVHFPLSSRLQRISQVLISVAPPAGSRSSFWAKGKMHRDFLDIETSGCYTFELLIDPMTLDNGAVWYWPESRKKTHDVKNPSRGMEGMDVRSPTGPGRTVIVWDARILHQSLPNSSDQFRTAIIWLVSNFELAIAGE